MINLIEKLEKNGFTYKTEEAIYFDTSKFTDYGKLSGQKVEEKQQGVREEVHVDPGKKHPADFALWFFLAGRFVNHLQHWGSPWGEGFPGWHIECSAMSMRYLGETIDIHTGGIDHIPVHHENEIAQSEAATGKKFVEFWVHDAFLQVNDEKMSKSKGNFYTLKDLQNNEIDPVALRYLFLQTHYRKPMNFSWEAAHGAEKALNSLKETVIRLKKENNADSNENDILKIREQFKGAIADDINVSKALAVIWEMLKNDISPKDKLTLIFEFDQVLGLNLKEVKQTENSEFPQDVIALAKDRLNARRAKDFAQSDALRNAIEEKGYSIEDTSEGYKLKKI
jgi:cysteinyl-tRNA synthetase